MLYALYCLSALSLLASGGSLLIAQKGSRFEGGAGMASLFVFLLAAAISVGVVILLYKQWETLSVVAKTVGLLGCLPLLAVIIALFYVIFFY